jgi:predicted transposase YbfD/YdcC
MVAELIEALELTGSTVTLDAMGCQKAIAAAIVGKEANYVLALKANQDTLCSQVKRLFDVTEGLNYKDFATAGHATRGNTDTQARRLAQR